MKANDLFESVTNKLLASMREAQASGQQWVRPWAVTSAGFPYNATTGKTYNGANVIWLWMESAEHGWGNQWATYRQWEGVGAQVRKGEKATHLVKWSPVPDKAVPLRADGSMRTKLVPNAFTVFNAAQVDGWEPPDAPERPLEARVGDAEVFFAGVGAAVRIGGDRAFYNIAGDFIAVPEFEAFTSAQDYYSTLAHEHTHWTGHPSRLDRDLKNRFGDQAYAAEELVAELGAAFVMASLGLSAEPRTDHGQYLASWIKVLADDSKAFFTAASKAKDAMAYLQTTAEAHQEAMV